MTTTTLSTAAEMAVQRFCAGTITQPADDAAEWLLRHVRGLERHGLGDTQAHAIRCRLVREFGGLLEIDGPDTITAYIEDGHLDAAAESLEQNAALHDSCLNHGKAHALREIAAIVGA